MLKPTKRTLWQLITHIAQTSLGIRLGPKPSSQQLGIMITCPCNDQPAKPHFYIVKLGFTDRRSHGKRQKGNDKRKRCTAQISGTSLNNLSSKLREHGRQAMLSFLSSLPIPVLHILDIEANMFYDRNHKNV